MGVYDDVVNVVSPGSLPFNITIEDIFSGRSEARNRVVAHVFKELGLIEQWGSGISRIINACKDQGLEAPKIEEKNDFFDVEIIRPVVIEEQPELQPEFEKLQPEFKAWINSGLEKEQQELQQEFNDGQPELQPESLYFEIVLRLAENNLSKQGLADALGHKSISGQLKVVINQLKATSANIKDLNTIRNKGRLFFIENPPENFSRIFHDYSDVKKGFIAWKGQLEERLV